jgi:NADPH2 dehydrogenase
LKNRITMAPLYLGYAGEGRYGQRYAAGALPAHGPKRRGHGRGGKCDGGPSTGSGSNRTLRADTDDNLDGLKQAGRGHQTSGRAGLPADQPRRPLCPCAQNEPLAPSAVETFGRMPKALELSEIDRYHRQIRRAAARAKAAGFDMVELHGGTGYLLAQFLSPRTNKRTDEYGGSLENRQRFALEVLARVKAAVGSFPVGYRFPGRRMAPGRLAVGRVASIRKTPGPGGHCLYFRHGRHV